MQGIGYYGGASAAAPLSMGTVAAAAAGVALIIVGTGLGLGLGIGLHSDDQNLTSITTTGKNACTSLIQIEDIDLNMKQLNR